MNYFYFVSLLSNASYEDIISKLSRSFYRPHLGSNSQIRSNSFPITFLRRSYIWYIPNRYADPNSRHLRSHRTDFAFPHQLQLQSYLPNFLRLHLRVRGRTSIPETVFRQPSCSNSPSPSLQEPPINP